MRPGVLAQGRAACGASCVTRIPGLCCHPGRRLVNCPATAKASYLSGDDDGAGEPSTFLATVWAALPVAFAPRSTPPAAAFAPRLMPRAAAFAPRSTPLAAAFAPRSTPPAAALAPCSTAFSTLTTTPGAVPVVDSADS